MRHFSAELQAHLDSGATTLCTVWKIHRRDGNVLGFTDHDRDVTFSGVTCSAASGLEGAKAESSLGLAVGGTEISGALTSGSLAETDLLNGLYDNASVEIWRVNWADPSMRELIDVGTIGEVTRTEHSFTAEVRSLAHAFDQVRGRLYQAGCSADLGDARCGVSLSTAAYRVDGVVASSDERLSLTAALGAYDSGWFTGGRLVFTTGANASAAFTVKSHRVSGGSHSIQLWSPVGAAIHAGDHFEISAGCDKTFAACNGKFANHVNFRGFPHMPGNDVVTSYPSRSDPVMDGGSLFR